MIPIESGEVAEKELRPPFATIEDLYGLPAIGSGHTHCVPELRLLSMLLADALEQALRKREIRDPGDRRDAEKSRQEAIEWIFSEEESWPCSFVAVCTALKLEPEGIRREIALRLHFGIGVPTNVRRLAHSVSRGIRRKRRPRPDPPKSPLRCQDSR